MNYCSLVGHHFLSPWAQKDSRVSLSGMQKAASIIVALAIGAVIGYLGSFYLWYVGIAAGGVGAICGFYLFSFCVKRCVASVACHQDKTKTSVPDYTFHEKQSLRLGLCGKHAINNAFAQEIETDEASYMQKVRVYLQEKTGLDLALVDPFDFGSDIAIIQHIIAEGPKGVKTKCAKIAELNTSIDEFVGDAKWVIIANTSNRTSFPSRGHAPHSIAAGHVFAGRRETQGIWWFIDSRYDFKVDMPLNQLHPQFTLIVPVIN